MEYKDVDAKKLVGGGYCRKGVEGCFCAVGWPYELMCSDCRDSRIKGDDKSYCVCPPKETEIKKERISKAKEECDKYGIRYRTHQVHGKHKIVLFYSIHTLIRDHASPSEFEIELAREVSVLHGVIFDRPHCCFYVELTLDQLKVAIDHHIDSLIAAKKKYQGSINRLIRFAINEDK
jgi:hypothetical protein